MKLLCALGQQA